MNMPEVKRCFGMFPPKYATYLISLFGMGSGGVGLAGLILYGIAEESIISHFVSRTKVDEDIKKIVLLCVGLTSLLLLIANGLLFIGVTTKAGGAVHAGYIIILVACSLLMLVFIALPMSCFFIPSTCLIKKISSSLTIIGILITTVFLEVWMYFAVVAWNFAQEL